MLWMCPTKNDFYPRPQVLKLAKIDIAQTVGEKENYFYAFPANIYQTGDKIDRADILVESYTLSKFRKLLDDYIDVILPEVLKNELLGGD